MKLPSWSYLLRKTSNSFNRFPLAISISLLTAVVGVYLTHLSYNYIDVTQTSWFKLFATFLIGIPLFIWIEIVLERFEVEPKSRLLFNSLGLIFLFIYFITLPEFIFLKSYTRMIVFFAIFHLCITFAPFIGFKQHVAFWTFNNILATRFIRTFVYGAVLFVGISLALVFLDALFDINLKERVYLQLFILVVFAFGPWFFLSGIPKYFNKLHEQKDFPNSIKIFVQFILIPIVILYTIILLAYFVKVIVLWEWPHGWVASLVLAYSLLVLFTFLTIYPIRLSSKHTFVRFFANYFSYAILPLLIILFISIFKRVSDYGITSTRYYVIILGLWLLVSIIYLIVTRYKDIKIIPLSLSILLFFSVIGPWNAFLVSKKSQMSRIIEMLEKYDMYQNNQFVLSKSIMPYEDYINIVSKTNYLINNFGYTVFKPYVDINLDSLSKIDTRTKYRHMSNEVVDYLRINVDYDSSSGMYRDYIYLNADTRDINKNLTSLKQYDYFLPINIAYYNNYVEEQKDSTSIILSHGQIIQLYLDYDKSEFVIMLNNRVIHIINIGNILECIPDNIIKTNSYYIPEPYLNYSVSNDDLELLFKINMISLYGNKLNISQINELKAIMFFTIKK